MKHNLINSPIHSDYLKNLLKARGIENIEEFLRPSIKNLNEPTLLKNIEVGAELLLDKIKNNKTHFLIIVDCDCDGYTSASIIYLYLEKVFNIKCNYYIHSGKSHGLEEFHRRFTPDMYDLIIIPDASSNDYTYHEQLKLLNIPILILDHHLAEPPFSTNATIINNQFGDYSNRDLTGAGVTWQFCRYLDEKANTNYSNELIDLAALGIVGDMGSLLNLENRYIVYTGLKYIKNYFFQALLEKQEFSIKGVINPTNIAFYIAPLINAVIRAGAQEEKENMFLAFIDGETQVPSGKRGHVGELVSRAEEIARQCANARTRQNTTKDKIVEQLLFQIQSNFLLDNKILFVELPETLNCPSTLTGLVAMQLCAKFNKPTLVGRITSNGDIEGSARGVNNSELTSLKSFLDQSHYFKYAEGHDQALGFGIKKDNVFNFLSYANNELKDYNFEDSSYNVDFERSANDDDLINLVMELGANKDLWGSNCPEPLLYIHHINLDKKDIQIIGARKDTVKFTKYGITYIQFFAKDLIQELSQYETFQINLIGRASINEWNGMVTPQILIQDYEVLNGDYSF